MKESPEGFWRVYSPGGPVAGLCEAAQAIIADRRAIRLQHPAPATRTTSPRTLGWRVVLHFDPECCTLRTG